MRRLNGFRGSLTVLGIALAFVTTGNAGTLLVSQISPYLGYGYGLSSWGTFTGDINSAFGGAANVTVNGSELTDLNYMLTFSSLMVTARQPGGQLTATEISNIAAYEATGRHVLLIGENSSWSAWNSSILSTVGGTFGGDSGASSASRLVNNSITAGTPTLALSGDGVAVGGTALYDQNVLTQWGTGNVVSLLSVNVQQNGGGNNTFDNDLAVWLASADAPPTESAPEPGTLLMLASGMLGLGVSLRRKQVR